jgi:hypothetical protein
MVVCDKTHKSPPHPETLKPYSQHQTLNKRNASHGGQATAINPKMSKTQDHTRKTTETTTLLTRTNSPPCCEEHRSTRTPWAPSSRLRERSQVFFTGKRVDTQERRDPNDDPSTGKMVSNSCDNHRFELPSLASEENFIYPVNTRPGFDRLFCRSSIAMPDVGSLSLVDVISEAIARIRAPQGGDQSSA